MRSKLILLLFAAFVDCRLALAECALKRPFCEALPDRSNPNAAIFLGLVKEIAPAPPLVLPLAAPGNSSPAVAQGRRRWCCGHGQLRRLCLRTSRGRYSTDPPRSTSL